MEVIVGVTEVTLAGSTTGHYLLNMMACSSEGRGMLEQSRHDSRESAHTAFASQIGLLRIIGLDCELVRVHIPNLDEAPNKWLVDYDPDTEPNAHVLHVD